MYSQRKERVMGSLDDSSVYEDGSEDCAHRKKKKHRKTRKSSGRTIAPAYEVEEAFTDEADTVGEECMKKDPISFGLECAYESKTEKKKKDQRRKKCESVTKDNSAYVESAKFAEKRYSSLSRHAQISDTVEARHRRKKHKKVKNFRDSESDDNEIEDAPCVMQCEQTDVEKEGQTISELVECDRICITVERKKRKKKKPCDAEYASCTEETDTLFSDENVNCTSGRVHKKKKYKATIAGHAEADSGSAVSDSRENWAVKRSAFSGKSYGVLFDAGGNQDCSLRTPHKKKKCEVAKEHFQEGTSCSLSGQQLDDCANNETCRSVGDSQCCSTGAVRKKKTQRKQKTMECADHAGDCALSCAPELGDNASLIDATGESAEMGRKLKKQSKVGLGTSLCELGVLPPKCNGGDCITQEHSSTQDVSEVAFKKKKRKLARLSTLGEELFHIAPLQADADSSETSRKGSKGNEVAVPENGDTVPSADLGSAKKKPKLHDQDTSGASYKTLSSTVSSQECTEPASQSLKAVHHEHRNRSDTPPDPDFLAYVNGEHRFPTIHHKTKPPLEVIRRYEEETGLTVHTGKYTTEEDFILLKNIDEIAKYYNIAYPHMIVGHCGDQDPALQKEVKDFVRKEQLIRLLGRGLPHRTIHSAYMRARLLLDPLSTTKKVVLTPEQKERLQQMYNHLGPKWTVMAQRMGLSAEQLRSAFRYVKEKETFATGKWEKSEEELLRRAVERQTGVGTAKLKDINWQAVSQYVRSRNALQCRRHWTFTQLTPPPGQETRKWNKFDSVHLIYIMHKLNASKSAEVDWEALGDSFPWATCPLVAKYHWESTLNFYLPPEQRDNFQSKVKNLYEIALPFLLKKYGKGRTLEEIIELSKSPTA